MGNLPLYFKFVSNTRGEGNDSIGVVSFGLNLCPSYLELPEEVLEESLRTFAYEQYRLDLSCFAFKGWEIARL